MTIFGYSKVEVENIDSELLWNVYRPNSNQVLVKVAYKHIFDTSEIKNNKDLTNALSACLCFLGMPNDDALNELFLRFPDLPRTPHKTCLKAMKYSDWATEKSKLQDKIKSLEQQIKTPKKKTPKKKKPPKQQEEEKASVFEDAELEVGTKKRKLNL